MPQHHHSNGTDMADNEECNMGTLLQRTRELIKQSDQSYSQMFAGSGLEPNWISGVATGRIKDPSVNRIQKLYEYLAGSKLAF